MVQTLPAAISGRGGRREGGKKGLVTLNRMLLALRNAGRTNQIEAACNLWHNFRFERVTRFIVDMAEKIQDCLLSSFTARLQAVDVQTK